VTLVITYWRRNARRAAAHFSPLADALRLAKWFRIAGDYMSAASFLGIAGIIAFQGYDGFMYSVGWLVAYLTVLLIVAEPLRNAANTRWRTCWLSHEGAARPRDGFAEHAHRQHVLHDRANGGRGCARHVAASKVHTLLFMRRSSASGVLIDRLRCVRRDARDDVGANHQGHLADGGTVLLSVLCSDISDSASENFLTPSATSRTTSPRTA